MLPPTSYLPPIKYIASYPLKTLNDALYYLRKIYNPEVRGSRRRRRRAPPRSLKDAPRPCSASDNTIVSGELLDTLRTDAFERNYAIKWLTALISQLGNDSVHHHHHHHHHESEEDLQFSKEDLLQNAASLLTICAGTASAGVIVRQFVFERIGTSEDDISDSLIIKVDLVDVPLDNHDYRSVGAQTWGSACVMAEMMVEHPEQFGLYHQLHHHLYRTDDMTNTFRCLELGAGTGLVSLVVTKLLLQRSTSTPVSTTTETSSNTKLLSEVVATDYYPSVLTNLERNVDSNFPDLSQAATASVRILTRALDWSTFSSETTTTTHEPLFETPFDLILGADVVYETQHAQWIKSCLTKLLRKPSSTTTTNPTFHLVIPLRATHTLESNTIEQVFPLNHNHNRSNLHGSTELVINHKEIIICDAEGGKEGEEDVEYAYYKIGWTSKV